MTTASSRPLTKLEALAVSRLVEWIGEEVEEVAVALDREALGEAIRKALLADGPMLAHLLGARLLESIRTGDKDAGADDPPLDGLLGEAIDGYMGKVWPLVLSPSVTTDEFRKNVLD